MITQNDKKEILHRVEKSGLTGIKALEYALKLAQEKARPFHYECSGCGFTSEDENNTEHECEE